MAVFPVQGPLFSLKLPLFFLAFTSFFLAPICSLSCRAGTLSFNVKPQVSNGSPGPRVGQSPPLTPTQPDRRTDVPTETEGGFLGCLARGEEGQPHGVWHGPGEGHGAPAAVHDRLGRRELAAWCWGPG